ncbi:DUF7108 domain-containing protein [Halorubrum laminariae]|uniref:RnhA operon protein n=1 Tax=Halorubrum laminariae TaxID=1433523 RepID=A0ABD6BZM4_9EURY|nr:hypothetical protein [Halorubrum laminariae]
MTGTDDEPPEWARERARELMAADADDTDAAAEAGDDDGDQETAANADDERDATEDRVPDLPADVVDEAERLTRLARETDDDAAAEFYRDRRDELVTDHDYVPRLRGDDDTLVMYPDEWMADGTVQLDRIETTERAVEVSLSGPGDADRFQEIAAYNDAVATAVAERESNVHADTARTFAAFMSNHYVRPIDDATPDMRAEFREEYLVRNGWPSEEQLAVADESLSVIEAVAADVDGPDA